jgi:hypothetical protein
VRHDWLVTPLKVPPNTLITSRTLPAKQLVGVVGLFIVTDEHPDESGSLTLKKTARLVKSDSVNLVEKSVTFEFWDGREPVVVAEDVLIESLVIEAPN